MLNTRRIRTTHNYGEVSPNTFPDFDWVGQNRAKLLEQYGECVLLVYEKQVLGVGSTHTEALKDAESRLPQDFEGELTPITYYLGHITPFYRVRPTIIKNQE